MESSAGSRFKQLSFRSKIKKVPEIALRDPYQQGGIQLPPQPNASRFLTLLFFNVSRIVNVYELHEDRIFYALSSGGRVLSSQSV